MQYIRGWPTFKPRYIGPGLCTQLNFLRLHKYVPRRNQGFTHGSIFHRKFGTAGSGLYPGTSPKITIGHSNSIGPPGVGTLDVFYILPQMYVLHTNRDATSVLRTVFLAHVPIKYSRNLVAVKGLNVTHWLSQKKVYNFTQHFV